MNGDPNQLTAVLFFKEDAERFLNERPHANGIYPLTLDALAVVIDKTDLPLPLHHQKFDSAGHMCVIADTLIEYL